MQECDEDVERHHENPRNEKLPLVFSQPYEDEHWWKSAENRTAKEHHAKQDIGCQKVTE